MDFAQLAAHVGETFTLAGIPVTLTTATPNGGGGSLVFAGPVDQPLEQATYEIAHPELLGMGATREVLEPLELRDMLRQTAKEMAALYEV